MDKSFSNSTPTTDSTQLNSVVVEQNAKPKSKTKVKSDSPIHRNNQHTDNHQSDLFNDEEYPASSPNTPDDEIDFNAIIEQSFVQTPDKSDATTDSDESQVLDEASVPREANDSDSVISTTASNVANSPTTTDEPDVADELTSTTASGEPKVTRISTKQRREELDRFKNNYLTPHKFVKKHNVAIEDEQWEQLDLIVRRIGDRKANATSYLYEIIASHLQDILPKTKEWIKL